MFFCLSCVIPTVKVLSSVHQGWGLFYCAILTKIKKFQKKSFFQAFKMPTKWRAFLCNATNFQLFEKSFEKTYKNRCFKSHPLRDVFSRAPWQLNDRPKVIWLCDDMSEATLRWNSGAGTISGKTAKICFWYIVNEITLPTKQNELQKKKSLKINPKSYSKKECDSYSENDRK